MKYRKMKGFTLIEILLVIGVVMLMSIIKIRDINQENQDLQAKLIAGQLQTVAEATNAFLVLKYNELSTLSSSGVSCNTAANTCDITLQNLNDNALLPPNFSKTTVLGNPYEIQLKRTGTAPNYMISGLVLTKGNNYTENTASLVFLGKILRDIGRDGGINKDTGKIIGTSNGWSADSTLFPILSNKINYIGSAVGTLSGAYYVYLRRDGSLPMTGDLNMDGHNIKNVNNLTATGEINTQGNIIASGNANISGNLSVGTNANVTGNIVAGKEVSAKNGYGDTITIGGDAGGEDYEIRTSNPNRPVSIYGVGETSYTTALKVNRNVSIGQRLGLMGYSPNDFPSGWGGGLRTLDVYAAGTVATGSNGELTSYMNVTGVHTKQNITASGNISADGNITGGNITGGTVTGNTIKSNGYVQIGGQASVGATCSVNGLQGVSSDGQSLSCVNGVWTKLSLTAKRYQVVFEAQSTTSGGDIYKRVNMGRHVFCVFAGEQVGSEGGLTKHSIVYQNSDYTWTLELRVVYWMAGVATWATAMCFD